jgi:hypothetical protein
MTSFSPNIYMADIMTDITKTQIKRNEMENKYEIIWKPWVKM